MKHRKAIWIGIFAALALLVAVLPICSIVRSEMLRQQAHALMEAGAYAHAKQLFDSLGDSENFARCDALQTEEVYQEGIEFLLAGDYDRARQILSTVSNYKEAAPLLKACNWQETLALGETENLMDTHRIFRSFGQHQGCQEALDQISRLLYAQAEDLAAEFKLDEACRIWEELGTYENSALLLWRGLRALDWAEAPTEQRLLVQKNHYPSQKLNTVYVCDRAYIVAPEECGSSTRFFLYFPGGWDEEMSVDYLHFYLMNPAPNTLAVFLRRNGLNNMQGKTSQAIDLLEQAAAECGLFVQDIAVAGSSLGAYPAMHSVIYTYEDYGIKTDCVLSLDAGSDWQIPSLLLDEDECRKTEKIGTAFYLFESLGVGMNREGIRLMVNSGNQVIMVGCIFDDHERISFDAMGMGVVDWAVGDRAQPCNPEIYRFTQLEPDVG